MSDKDYLTAAAYAVAEQLADNAALHVPLDPDVADFMGAFREDALSLADVIEDGLITLTAQGEVGIWLMFKTLPRRLLKVKSASPSIRSLRKRLSKASRKAQPRGKSPGIPATRFPRRIIPFPARSTGGVNRLSLALSGYDDPRWMTFNQAKTQGYSIKGGSKSEPVVYYQWTKEETLKDDKGKPILDKDGKEQKSITEMDKPFLRFARVFNAEQIEGIPPVQLTDKSFAWNPIDKGESILAASGADIKHDQSNQAFYRTRDDSIHLPPKENFEEPGGYYGTALHELAHWTKHPSRLNRESGPFGTEQYAREELRAEISSWMLAQDTGIPHDPGQHTAYVDSWIQALEKDPFEIQRACRDAEQIRDYLLELELRKEKGLDAPAPEPLPDREEAIAARSLPERPAPEKPCCPFPTKKRTKPRNLARNETRKPKSWFAPEGTDLAKLRDWLPVEDVRVFALNRVDMPEREGFFSAQVQKAGLWSHIQDKEGEPVLFATVEAARALADTHLPKAPERDQPVPVLSPQAEFDKALYKAGLDLQGQEPLLDGEIHRVPLLSGNEAGGAYVGYDGEQPHGWSQNFQTGDKTPWIATGHVLSQEEIQKIVLEREEQRQKLEDSLFRIRDEAAQEAWGDRGQLGYGIAATWFSERSGSGAVRRSSGIRTRSIFPCETPGETSATSKSSRPTATVVF